uniref:Integrase core domain containing protein n=1 Tax=Solanum tuberosum TaxID=4113 RepID=M1CXV0_SOLTU
MARIVTKECRVLTGSLHTVLDIHMLFNLHKCDWMARDLGTYNEEIVREFYASYAATLRGLISKRSKPIAQDPFTSTMVWGCLVDISHATISCFLYGPTTGHSWSLNTAEFDYRWDIVRSGAFQRNAEQDSGVPIWHCDRLIYPIGTLDIGLIRDEANVAAPRREPQVEDAPTALADDMVLDALFSGTTEEGPEPTHTKDKRHRSSHTEEEKAQKRQRRQEKEARKASILDEELRQQRVRESIAGASSSAQVVEVPPVVRDVVSTIDGAVRVTESTTEGAMMVDVSTTEGDPSMVPASSGKPDPPAC